MSNEPVWTDCLENQGTGECPVPEWAQTPGSYRLFTDTGSELSPSNIPAHEFGYQNGYITHYRYAVPADLAWLARNASEWNPDAMHQDESGISFLHCVRGEASHAHPNSYITDVYPERAYTKAQWLRARRDLGYEETYNKTQDREAFGPEFGEPDPNADDPGQHYRRYEYRGIKLDPYRIAMIYNMQGGPREQIMKKCLRFTDKGQTEREAVAEIRSALNRWEELLEEDEQ